MSERIYINNNWQYLNKFDPKYIEKTDNSFVNVSIPHTVVNTPFNYFDESIYQMVSTYVKELDVLKQWKGKHVKLTFEGAAHEATVFVNGTKKLTHKCGYTAFSVDITSEVEVCDHITVLVKLDSRETLNQPPFGYVIDYMTYGGIYRDVYLEISEKSFIEDAFYYSEISGNEVTLLGSVLASLDGESGYKAFIEVDGKNYEAPALEKTEGNLFKSDFKIKLGSLKLWDIDAPNLYEIKAVLKDSNDKTKDERTDKTGFRKAEFKTDGFYLNDRKVKIRGLNRHQSYPYIGYAMPKSMQEMDADVLKNELGLNAVRTSHYPQSHDFIARCDELGLLVFTEIPGWQHIGDKEWKEQAVVNTHDMVMQYRNHPSIILWGVRINESADDDEFYKATNEMAHKCDPSRPTGGVRAHKNSNLFEDVYTYNDFVHDGESKGCEPKKKVTSDVNKPYLVSEYNGHMYPTKAFDWEEHRREHAIRHANVLNAISGEEDIAGSFGWCMFDYNTHKDFGSGDRICYHGVMDMFRNEKLASLIYKCEGDTDEAVLEISSTMDIGEHPGCNRGAVWIFSNADSVKMYKNGKLLKEYFPGDSPYKNLKHGPIMVDDFVGNAIVEGENFSPKLSKEIKEMMNATALNGLSHLPKRAMFLAAKAILIHHLSFGDAVRLYNKYVGDWGGTSTVYKFEAVKNGKVVKTLVKEPVSEVKLVADKCSLALRPGKAYDVQALRLKAVDQNGNVLVFFNEPLAIKTEGDIELIGPDVISLKGGLGGIYVKSKDGVYEGSGKVHISSSQAGTITCEVKYERDTKWNVLK